MRLFIGIEIPEAIGDRISDLEVPLQRARWVEQQDYHLSLRFIGEVERQVAYDLDEALLGIDMPAFEIEMAGVGFAGGYEPKALWVGIAPSPALMMLQRAVDRAVTSVGVPPDKRTAFRPHTTIARLNQVDLDRFARYLERHALFRTEPFVVERFAMFSAKPSGGGPYVVEQTYDLKQYTE